MPGCAICDGRFAEHGCAYCGRQACSSCLDVERRKCIKCNDKKRMPITRFVRQNLFLFIFMLRASQKRLPGKMPRKSRARIGSLW